MPSREHANLFTESIGLGRATMYTLLCDLRLIRETCTVSISQLGKSDENGIRSTKIKLLVARCSGSQYYGSLDQYFRCL